MIHSEQSPDKEDFEGGVLLSKEDAREAARLFRILAEAVGLDPLSEVDQDGPLSRETLVSRARIVLHNRRARARHFKRTLFGEPAWEVLLALYIAEDSGARQTLGRLADQTETPLSTVIRWIDFLEIDRLVERVPHPNDKRVVFVRMLEKGRMAMDRYLSEMAWRSATQDRTTHNCM